MKKSLYPKTSRWWLGRRSSSGAWRFEGTQYPNNKAEDAFATCSLHLASWQTGLDSDDKSSRLWQTPRYYISSKRHQLILNWGMRTGELSLPPFPHMSPCVQSNAWLMGRLFPRVNFKNLVRKSKQQQPRGLPLTITWLSLMNCA
jgi:hypothetical protein